MADIELVEQLRNRANVTYDEAREALDACDDDLLEAVIYLEKQGKVPPPSGNGSFSSKQAPPQDEEYSAYTESKSTGDTFSSTMRRFGNWLKEMLKKSREYQFVVTRHDGILCSVPVLVLLILLICCFWITLGALVVGLFFSCRYSVKGPKQSEESKDLGINAIMDEVAEATEHLKNEIKSNGYIINNFSKENGNKEKEADKE